MLEYIKRRDWWGAMDFIWDRAREAECTHDRRHPHAVAKGCSREQRVELCEADLKDELTHGCIRGVWLTLLQLDYYDTLRGEMDASPY